MDPLSMVASVIGLVAIGNDLSRLMLKFREMNNMREGGPSAIVREVTRLMSVMDACTHC